jgi:hypothetical protein
MIPKIIYMCHKNLDKIKIYSKNWSKLNPEYEIKLYDDKLCEKFFLEEYSKLHYDIFKFIKDGPIKADFWRICIIYKYGGYYVDADIEPLVPLKTYVEDDDDFVTCLSYYNYSYNPHIIFANKDDEVLKKCINLYIHYYNTKKPYSYWGWSIVNVMNYVLGFKINNSDPGVYYVENKKFKFLKEQEDKNYVQYCTYNNINVLKNRYIDYKNHNFVDGSPKKYFVVLFYIFIIGLLCYIYTRY